MKTKLLVLSILICGITNAQSPNWQWAKSIGGSDWDEAHSLTVDATGNTYIAGYFQSTSLIFGSTTLTNVGGGDIFFAKYDALGNVLWAKSAGGTGSDWANSIVVDAIGNTYIAGGFDSPTLSFGATTLTNSGSGDLFLAKYDPMGNVLWAKSAAGANADGVNSIAVDAAGNTYIIGGFWSPNLNFGSTTLINANSGAGSIDMFLAKYDGSGNILWAKSAGGTSNDEAKYLTIDTFGNTYMTGYYSSNTISFGSNTLTSMGNNETFLVKYDASGNVLWAQSAGGTSSDITTSLDIDTYGNTYVAGMFSSQNITFGTFNLINGNSNGSADIFLAKYDASGNVLWAKSAGGTNRDMATSLTVDALGNTYITGIFQSTAISFGSTTLVNMDNTSNTSDIFLSKYDAFGNVLWAKSAGGMDWDEVFSLDVDASGNNYIGGRFRSSTLSFGSTTLTNIDNTGNTGDIFLAKLGSITGVDELRNPFNISVFPNPSGGLFTIKSERKSIVEIENLCGEKIYSCVIYPNKSEIDLSNQSNGIYFINIKTEQDIVTQKIIINK